MKRQAWRKITAHNKAKSSDKNEIKNKDSTKKDYQKKLVKVSKRKKQ